MVTWNEEIKKLCEDVDNNPKLGAISQEIRLYLSQERTPQTLLMVQFIRRMLAIQQRYASGWPRQDIPTTTKNQQQAQGGQDEVS